MSDYPQERENERLKKVSCDFHRYCIRLMFLNANVSQIGAIRLDKYNLKMKFKG